MGIENSGFQKEKIMEEEAEHLSAVIGLVNNRIENISLTKMVEGIGPYSTANDKESYMECQYDKKKNERNSNELNQLKSIADTPYFARFDLVVKTKNITSSAKEGVYKALYIGEKGFYSNNEIIVYDWRTPVTLHYSDKGTDVFEHNEHVYTVLLRRSFTISKGVLHEYNDEYLSDMVDSDTRITDPFLISILRGKRKSYRLTNIIRSIQKNQNAIIRHPISESFVVQGCAGSGKTVIMLHRLSYLYFNHPNYNWTKTRIITPSKNLNVYMEGLWRELELEKVEKICIEDYYVLLLRKYDSAKWKTLVSVRKDLELGKGYIENIYSQKLFDDIASIYEKYMEQLAKELEPDIIANICKMKGYTCEYKGCIKDERSISSFIAYLKQIIEENEKNQEELEKLYINKNAAEKRQNKKITSIVIENQSDIIDQEIEALRKTINDLGKEYLELGKQYHNFCKEKGVESKGIQALDFLEDCQSKMAQTAKFSEKDISTFANYYKKMIGNSSDILEKECNLKELKNGKSRNKREIEKKQKEQINVGKNLEVINHKIRMLEAKALSSNELKKIRMCLELAKKDHYERIETEVGKELLKNPRRGGKKNSSSGVYRYQLYIGLIIYCLLRGPLIDNDIYLHIDEGQDLSSMEFKLLKEINGEKLVLNVYGDINQGTLSKPIKDWEEINFINHIYELKENYRNTVQIAEYCNTLLNKNYESVGIIGPDVVSVKVVEALQQIGRHIRNRTKERIAVIVHDFNEDFVFKCIEAGCIKGISDDNQICVLTVEEVKGMEYEIVYVREGNMSENERYISYTRALENLIIVD